jgi:hypothetical protein
MKIEFSQQIFGKYLNSNFMEIRPVGAELFHVERRTYGWKDGRMDGRIGMTKLIVAFWQFCKRA